MYYIFLKHFKSIEKENKLTCSNVSPVCLCLYNALKPEVHNRSVLLKSWPKQAFRSCMKFVTALNALLVFLPQTAHLRLHEVTTVIMKEIPKTNFNTVILTNFFFEICLSAFVLSKGKM